MIFLEFLEKKQRSLELTYTPDILVQLSQSAL